MKQHSNKKYLEIIIISVLAVAFIFYLINAAKRPGDFNVFLKAASFIMDNKSPYGHWFGENGSNYCLYFYSPLWAIILSPLKDTNQVITNSIWLLLNVFFLYRIYRLLIANLKDYIITRRQRNLIFFFTTILSLRFILYNFDMIQMSIFMLWGCLESIRLFKKGNNLAGGALLALIINIKLLPLVILPYLIYRKYFKGAIISITFILIYLLIPALFVGWENNLEFHKDWWQVIAPSNTEHLIESEFGPHSLTAFIPPLLTETEGSLPYSRNIVNLNPETAIFISNIIRVGLIFLTLVFLKWPPFKKARSNASELCEIAYILLLVPLIFPHQQKYAFIFTMPAMMLICTYLVLEYKNRNAHYNKVMVLTILSFLFMTLTTDGVVGRTVNQITQHYKTITWGAILLIVLLLLIKPDKRISEETDVKKSN